RRNDLVRRAAARRRGAAMSLGVVRVADVLRTARARAASDVHLGGADRTALRIDGRLLALDGPGVDDAGLREFLHAVLSAEQLARLDARGAGDGAAMRGGDAAPYRVHAFRHGGGTRVAIRLLAEHLPELDALGLPAAVASFADRASGL